MKGLKYCAAGFVILAGSISVSLAQTTTQPAAPATQTPAVQAPAPSTPAAPPAATPPAPKTTDQIQPTDDGTAPATAPATTPAAPAAGAEQPAQPDAPQAGQPDAAPDDGADSQDDLSIGEIPDIKIVDLTLDKAKAAVDTYSLLKDKYKDAKLEDYETLQEFVDKDPMGKAFDADVKAAGFSDVETWNQTITTVSTTYSNMINDQTADTQAQIADVEKDTELAKDMKDKLLASLRALIPTDNNRKVVQSLMDDANYKDKIKLLESEEE